MSFTGYYKTTARRDKIAIHSYEYYRALFQHSREYRDKSQELRLYVAEHEGEALAAIIVLFRGEEATYLYGLPRIQSATSWPPTHSSGRPYRMPDQGAVSAMTCMVFPRKKIHCIPWRVSIDLKQVCWWRLYIAREAGITPINRL